MKSVIIAIIILTLMFLGSLYISNNQKNALIPVRHIVDKLLYEESVSPHRELEECIESLNDKRFVIELGLPGDDFDKVYYLLKSALRLLDTDDKTLYYEKLEECKIYLESLIEYSRADIASIL